MRRLAQFRPLQPPRLPAQESPEPAWTVRCQVPGVWLSQSPRRPAPPEAVPGGC